MHVIQYFCSRVHSYAVLLNTQVIQYAVNHLPHFSTGSSSVPLSQLVAITLIQIFKNVISCHVWNASYWVLDNDVQGEERVKVRGTKSSLFWRAKPLPYHLHTQRKGCKNVNLLNLRFAALSCCHGTLYFESKRCMRSCPLNVHTLKQNC